MMNTGTEGRAVAFQKRAASPQWTLSPLGNRTGGRLTVDRVSIVRIACVAAETGARMQRDGLAVDPLGWMITPLVMFGGRPPIEACMEAEACARVFLLHGLGLDLDADPELLERLILEDELANEEAGCD